MTLILDKLKGGDLRSIGISDKIIKLILKDPKIFGDVFVGMKHADPLVRMRSADIIEKVSKEKPEYLQPFKSKLINEISKIEQQEVRWHVAQMFSYIRIDKKERDKIIKILLSYIETDKSRIVKTFALQTLADFAERDPNLKPMVIKIIQNVGTKHGGSSPAILSRVRKLLVKLDRKVP